MKVDKFLMNYTKNYTFKELMLCLQKHNVFKFNSEFKSKHFDEQDPKFQDFIIDYDPNYLVNCNFYRPKAEVLFLILESTNKGSYYEQKFIQMMFL